MQGNATGRYLPRGTGEKFVQTVQVMKRGDSDILAMYYNLSF